MNPFEAKLDFIAGSKSSSDLGAKLKLADGPLIRLSLPVPVPVLVLAAKAGLDYT